MDSHKEVNMQMEAREYTVLNELYSIEYSSSYLGPVLRSSLVSLGKNERKKEGQRRGKGKENTRDRGGLGHQVEELVSWRHTRKIKCRTSSYIKISVRQ